jgi:molecular chaperone DnaK (HSP70)
MGWSNWARKAESTNGVNVGLDLTAGRARGVSGPAAGVVPRVLQLDDDTPDLPLAISLENRTPVVGRAGAALVRRLPHLVCRVYLPALGLPREWRANRHKLDPAGAVAVLAQQLRQAITGHPALAVAVPAYLTVKQVTLLIAALEHAKLPVLGTMTAPLAVAAAHADDRIGTALVADADEHALTWTVLSAGGAQVRVLAAVDQPTVGARAWLDRVLDMVSDRCVRLCRRDPRDSAAAEQAVYEQLDAALDHLRPGQPVALNVRTPQWYQALALTPEELEQFCAPLAKSVVDGMRQALAQAHAAVPAMAPPDVLWLTADAARLPGLTAAVGQQLPELTAIRPLPADAVAKAAHALAARWQAGELPRGHLDSMVPLPSRLRLSDSPVAKPQTGISR